MIKPIDSHVKCVLGVDLGYKVCTLIYVRLGSLCLGCAVVSMKFFDKYTKERER